MTEKINADTCRQKVRDFQFKQHVKTVLQKLLTNCVEEAEKGNIYYFYKLPSLDVNNELYSIVKMKLYKRGFTVNDIPATLSNRDIGYLITWDENQ